LPPPTDDTSAFDARFLHDVADPDVVRGAHDRLCAQSSAVFGAETTAAAWERVPSTYLVCAEERSTDPDLQRAQATRATTVRELPAAHFPFLSRPDLVAACIEEIAPRAYRLAERDVGRAVVEMKTWFCSSGACHRGSSVACLPSST